MKNIRRNVKALRKIGYIIDVLNLLLGVSIIILSIFILFWVEKNIRLFSVLFFNAFIMNLLMAIKYELRGNARKAIIQGIIALVFFIISAIAFLGLWR